MPDARRYLYLRRLDGRIPVPDLEALPAARYEPSAAAAVWELSHAHVDAVPAVVREGVAGDDVGLRGLTKPVDRALGAFPEFTTEIAAGVRSQLAAL